MRGIAISPRVSVVMLVGPSAPYLEEAVESLNGQSFHDFELLQQHEKGITTARNAGCRRARGEYIAIMDSDDIAYPDRFERQVAYMDRYRGVSVVGSWCYLFGKWDMVRGGMRKSRILRTPETVTSGLNFMWPRIPNSSAMMRTADVLPFGPYRDVLLEDYDLWIRLLRAGKRMANIPQVLMALRGHADSHSKGIPHSEVIRNEILERMSCFKFSGGIKG